jgi:hypothetical protein
MRLPIIKINLKVMKKILLMLFCLCFITLHVKAQNEVWKEIDNYRKVELLGDSKGTSILVDVTCSAKTLADVISKATKIAAYDYIFIGIPGASPIAKLAGDEVYEQQKEFFIEYLNSGLTGISTGNHNKAKPSSEVPDPNGKKKDVLTKATITVTLNIDEIRKKLEDKKIIQSMSSLKERLGEITVVVRPSKEWMEKLGLVKVIDNQGKQQKILDYANILDGDFRDIQQKILNNLSEAFKIDDITAQLAAANNESLQDNLAIDVDLQESPEDILTRTIQADIYLEVNFVKGKVDNGQRSEFSLYFTGIDPYTNSSSDMPGEIVRKQFSGDDFKTALDAACKTACDDFRSKAVKFLEKREKNGLKGQVIFKVDNGVSLTFDSKLNVGGEKITFSELITEAVEELATTGETSGTQTSTKRTYNVTIPTKRKNRKGTEVANNYEKFAQDVEKYISENLKDVQAIVKPIGKGKVTVIFRPVE